MKHIKSLSKQVALVGCSLLCGCTMILPENPNIHSDEHHEPPGPMPGGYSEATNWDPHAATLAEEAVFERFHVAATVTGCKSQVVAGMNYEFQLKNRSQGRYFSVVVYRPLDGGMRVTSVREN